MPLRYYFENKLNFLPMPIYTAYFVFLGISALSFFIALIMKFYRKNREQRRDNLVWGVIGTVVVYYLIRLIFGWRISNWYAEAILILGICLALDYFILIKYRYSQQLRIVYYCLRMTGIIVPIILFVMAVGVTLVSLGFSKGVACYVVPVDTSYGEQWVYKNLYVYQGNCKLSRQLVFKKKFLFLEKELMTIGGEEVFYSSDTNTPLTGYIYRKNDSVVYLSGEKYLEGVPEKEYSHIKITVMNTTTLKLEPMIYSDNKAKNEILETSQVKYIKL